MIVSCKCKKGWKAAKRLGIGKSESESKQDKIKLSDWNLAISAIFSI